MHVIDLFSTSEKLGRIWLEVSEPGKGVNPGPAPLGDARKLLAPIAALQVLADDVRGDADPLPVSKQLEKKMKAVRAAAVINRRFLGDDPIWADNSLWSDDERELTEDRLEALKARLDYCLMRAREAERIIQKVGYEFNPRTKQVQSRGTKGRPALLLNRCIVAMYVEIITKASPDTSPRSDIRKTIATVLRRYFPREKLNAGPHGNIDKAIEKYLAAPGGGKKEAFPT